MAEEDHSFSVVLFSDKYVRNLYLKDKSNGVFFEGFLGPIKEICFVEDIMLEISGVYGIIRIDLDKHNIVNALNGQKDENSRESISGAVG